ncbi:MAG: NUDIX domain-containing protein [Acidobacteria bacterium]|nr:NUDIX domain-containing protein [Acidobacteriota bacterium]
MTELVLWLLETGPAALRASNPAGHVTASAWIVDRTGQFALLTHHAKLGAWFQPGGHVEDSDASVADAAAREAREECGIEAVHHDASRIFDVDVHLIPARGGMPAHHHHDVRYLLAADREAPLVPTSESRQLSWIPLARVVDFNPSESIARMVRKSLQRASSSVIE